LATLATNLGRNLIVGTTNSTRTNLDHRLDVVESLVKGLYSVSSCLLSDNIESAIKSSLCNALLSTLHDYVNSFTNDHIAETWVRNNYSLKIALLS
jgi:hypothetical protein